MIAMGRNRDRSGRVPSVSRVKSFSDAAVQMQPAREDLAEAYTRPQEMLPLGRPWEEERGNGY